MVNRRKIAMALLKVYKSSFSYLFYGFGARCHYNPTCSEYAAECVAQHGWWPGLWMGLARLQRCRPGGGHGGDDPPKNIESVPFWAPWRYGVWRHRGPEGPNDDA